MQIPFPFTFVKLIHVTSTCFGSTRDQQMKFKLSNQEYAVPVPNEYDSPQNHNKNASTSTYPGMTWEINRASF